VETDLLWVAYEIGSDLAHHLADYLGRDLPGPLGGPREDFQDL
jgi:hypothetical protein